MLCLSVRQPWAWMIVVGLKRWENRSWSTEHRGGLLIQATRTANQEVIDQLGEIGIVVPDPLPIRQIIGRVELTNVAPVADVRGELFATGPFCWRFQSPLVFEHPIPWRGQQRLFHVDHPEIDPEVELARENREAVFHHFRNSGAVELLEAARESGKGPEWLGAGGRA